MINVFKKKKEKIKEEFTIGEFDFKIDSANSTLEFDGNKIIDLTIKADQNVYENLCEDDNFEFGYGLYPPEFYAREIDLGKRNQIVINEKNQYDIETALYFMEHNDVEINLSVHDNWILVAGWTYISGKKHPIIIKKKK